MVVVCLAALAAAVAPDPATATAFVDPVLTAALSTALPGDELVAVAELPAVPAPGDLAALQAVGVDAVGYTMLPYAAVRGTPAELTALSALPGVRSLWGNKPLALALHESAPQIGAPAVWDATGPYGFTGRGVRVAVLDSGIDGTHPDVAYPTKTVQNVKLLGYTRVFADLVLTLEDQPVTDITSGHGTHVAGIVAGDGSAYNGYYRGIAPGADLIGLGAAEGVEMITALAGYDWVLANKDRYGIRVINNSWADGSMAYDERDPLIQASLRAYRAGIVVVFAAGNDGQSSGNVFNRYAWPSWVVSVGGVDKNGVLGTYSSRGDEAHHPDVVAPGSFIASAMARLGFATDANGSPVDFTDPFNPRFIPADQLLNYSYLLGTSMAAPHVAGVVALMLEANPDLTPDQVRSIVVGSADALPGCPLVIDCGAGLVDAVGAVQGALAARPQPPVAAATAPAEVKKFRLATFDASASSDPDGSVVSYEWTFGDGSTVATGASPVSTHAYARKGVYQWTLRVTDDDALTASTSGLIAVA